MNMSSLLVLLAHLFIFFHPISALPVTYNVVSFGAKPDGRTESTKSFLSAWTSACGSARPAIIYVPPGRYLLGKAKFGGRCKNSAITIRIDGTLVAPSDYNVIGNAGNWLLFDGVHGVSIFGGTLDGQGSGLWTCKDSGKRCPRGATRINLAKQPNVSHRDPWLPRREATRSEGFGLRQEPEHGCIGSLGKDLCEPGVQNVTVKTVTFTGAQNGMRIKTWGRPSNGFVRGVLFQHIDMVNVKNPILIDQNYCPNNKGCPRQASGVKISDVTYQDIHGTSATKVAVKFECSQAHPCSGIRLEDVKLTYKNEPAHASCANADGTASGFVEPTSCL
ncbi:pectin lyase-like superfamily protein [Actinidia rufa]|uniref:Pectin lyase-like superfamily protein n=1 Tax=Actinidia rufa TaxID=165716 RepID=A0A7J0E1S3_9ERIC|nr:pectin lyase-like superfamily protein [Actinidia rufa]